MSVSASASGGRSHGIGTLLNSAQPMYGVVEAGDEDVARMALRPLAEPCRQSRRVEPGVAHALGGVRRRLEAYGI